MPAEKRYSVILEHTGQVLLYDAPLSQLEAFWDANDTLYFGLRMEDEVSEHARVFVTDVVPEEEDAAFA